MHWPTDILSRILHFLTLKSSGLCARQQLAFLTFKNNDLAKAARVATRPLIAEIEFSAEQILPLKFMIPFANATIVNIEIDWGDGMVEKVQERGLGFIQHLYILPGRYTVRIFPSGPDTGLDHLGFYEIEDPSFDKTLWWRPLRSLDSLGTLGIISLTCLFADVDKYVDLSKLQIDGVQNLCLMFKNNREFNQPISHWNVSSVTRMAGLFRGATNFNQDISRWNMSRVKSTAAMFREATSFNQPIGDWDVGWRICFMLQYFSINRLSVGTLARSKTCRQCFRKLTRLISRSATGTCQMSPG
jgi:surface protein